MERELSHRHHVQYKSPVTEFKAVEILLITVVYAFLILFLLIPLITVFSKAFEKGWGSYLLAISHPDTLAAIKLTVFIVVVTLPLQMIFGVSAAWLITKFNFHGKRLLTTVIDLPFAVSPVIAGLVFVLLFGSNGLLGPWLMENGWKVIYSVPGMILATIFVTFPFIARELIPFMQHEGIHEEEASLTLGANGWKTFFFVTLPNIKWALFYGVILAGARAIGEFGAVSVVSGHIRGMTNTMPLHIEILYNEYQFQAAFAVASLMAFVAVITLIMKQIIQQRDHRLGKRST
ncbi:sulfate ABC transporter permease subunit CysW [Bacillus safensis]|uniref:sulfate ABC transporter permease subunit CysW n=1 Tax=Bacillus safensis TaxID=561879 RepID=UPI00227FF354|nr:sulfate ABC transporter permease subunit CysW [Bacillus safensis]MCY7625299.1 sulfate ABC transporter permease subunit CysW [Bacillus safensis]MCY7653710.1 sulfate ABC transporter permease subunit CysW [Bacillus safensis]MCY7661563.1 sulfate ABC transporter permease subunit CysW [Bacillus safensis]MCY7664309.1 sulfate ABC transporter permease subunit CysW [Bacillus safensis]MCY7667316.1 sulfate ABC transporter permease subunit CysW [Bacillus safensis]